MLKGRGEIINYLMMRRKRSKAEEEEVGDGRSLNRATDGIDPHIKTAANAPFAPRLFFFSEARPKVAGSGNFLEPSRALGRGGGRDLCEPEAGWHVPGVHIAVR